MAKKKAAKSHIVRISGHLEKPLASVLKDARALKGKVVEAQELNFLISNLEALQATAQSNCPRQTWLRTFTVTSTATARSSKKR